MHAFPVLAMPGMKSLAWIVGLSAVVVAAPDAGLHATVSSRPFGRST